MLTLSAVLLGPAALRQEVSSGRTRALLLRSCDTSTRSLAHLVRRAVTADRTERGEDADFRRADRGALQPQIGSEQARSLRARSLNVTTRSRVRLLCVLSWLSAFGAKRTLAFFVIIVSAVLTSLDPPLFDLGSVLGISGFYERV